MSLKDIVIKKDKRKSLIMSALNLFKTKGIYATTVSDIVKSAGVAKGTFYLYFKDKDEIINNIIMTEASNILEDAIKKAEHLPTTNISDKIIFIANEVIDVFVSNKENIEIIHKNLYKGLFSTLHNSNSLFSKAVNEFISHTDTNDTGTVEKKLYIIIEMISGVCYNSVSVGTPYKLDEIKPALFDAIKSIVDS